MSASSSSSKQNPENDKGSSSSVQEEPEDADLKIINARRMLELRKKMNTSLAAQKKAEEEKNAPPKKPQPTDRDILLRALKDRGDEVLAAAEYAYPREMAILIPKLAGLVKEGKITTISGGELLQFFRSIGMRVSVATSISVQEHGKFMNLADKLKREYKGNT